MKNLAMSDPMAAAFERGDKTVTRRLITPPTLTYPWSDELAAYIREYHGSGYAIVAGPAARGFDHCCVYRGTELAHDPHPDRSGLDHEKDWTIVWVSDVGRFAEWRQRAGGTS